LPQLCQSLYPGAATLGRLGQLDCSASVAPTLHVEVQLQNPTVKDHAEAEPGVSLSCFEWVTLARNLATHIYGRAKQNPKPINKNRQKCKQK